MAREILVLKPVVKKINKFRISIPTTPIWKLEAIAKYKLKLNKNPQDTEKPISAAHLKSKALPFTKTDKVASIVKEREILERNADVVKSEIMSLNLIKSKLLWLLDKAVLHEVEKNHSIRQH